jgi:hypothetical protein
LDLRLSILYLIGNGSDISFVPNSRFCNRDVLCEVKSFGVPWHVPAAEAQFHARLNRQSTLNLQPARDRYRQRILPPLVTYVQGNEPKSFSIDV